MVTVIICGIIAYAILIWAIGQVAGMNNLDDDEE